MSWSTRRPGRPTQTHRRRIIQFPAGSNRERERIACCGLVCQSLIFSSVHPFPRCPRHHDPLIQRPVSRCSWEPWKNSAEGY
ncbi:hypothetical protein Bpfe_019678 [Biomphalaria pfeifferi]|uniref:Uncharacterized protein n=1 Tax=Biomphalaria pfeifferi TaxID=112525 RepID=A0AAD8BAB2_BIOPF|nr:hypothetical protein Bpfe_019678 [Biomphalaria pfeifferi]